MPCRRSRCASSAARWTSKLATATAKQTAGSDLGSIGAMREDAEFLDQIVEDAMKARREQPWRLSPGE